MAFEDKSAEEIAQEEKLARDQELEDIKFLMSHKPGERFFRRLFESGKIFCTSFTGDNRTFFLEGQRNLALKFFADVCEATPEKVKALITDNGGSK